MGRFVDVADRHQASFLPACLEDYVYADNPVPIIDAFVDELDLAQLGFERVRPAATGRPGYAPATMLKLYIYGYLHQLTSSRKLEREAGRNIELMWLTGKLASHLKTIADFRRDNTSAIQIACHRFVAICRALGLVGGGTVAIDGSRLRAVNTHKKNYTKGKTGAPQGSCRREHRALSCRARAGRQRRDRCGITTDRAPDRTTAAKAGTGSSRMIALADRGYYEGEQIRSCAESGIVPMVPKPKPNTSPAQARGFWGKPAFVYQPETDTYRCPAGQQLQKRFAREEGVKLIGVDFNQKACGVCPSRPLCTAGKEKRIRRWEHEAVLDAMERRLEAMPDAMAVRGCTLEHVLGTIKGWMGATHFRTRGLKTVATEASLTILAYNIKRALAVAGVAPILTAIMG